MPWKRIEALESPAGIHNWSKLSPASIPAVDDAHAGDLDDPRHLGWRQTGGLGIEHHIAERRQRIIDQIAPSSRFCSPREKS